MSIGVLKERDLHKRGRLPFYDEAGSGELCMVPCWPVDANNNAVDCPFGHVLIGVYTRGIFRAEECEPFDPKQQTWVCPTCKANREPTP